MMTKKKWLVVVALALVAAAGLVTVAVVIGLSVMPVGSSLPVYKFQQTASSHPGYRRTTIRSGTTVYVQDYDEYALRLAYPEPTNAIGRTQFGGGKVCAIPGQKPAAYVAVDCGSEMPAYEVFRNSRQPPFDWRTLQFQSLQFEGAIGRTEHKSTTEPAVIDDVLHTLRDGMPTTNSLPASLGSPNISGMHLVSDQLPGLIFCPEVYRDSTGAVYLAESMAVEFTNSTTSIHARWIPAGLLFTKWVQTP